MTKLASFLCGLNCVGHETPYVLVSSSTHHIANISGRTHHKAPVSSITHHRAQCFRATSKRTEQHSEDVDNLPLRAPRRFMFTVRLYNLSDVSHNSFKHRVWVIAWSGSMAARVISIACAHFTCDVSSFLCFLTPVVSLQNAWRLTPVLPHSGTCT